VAKRARAKRPHQVVSLRPADPFELIRWLARSQSDPRKAVAELVQNSLDAGARTIRIERRRVRGAVQLAVHDDGEGVLPELARREALEYLATHVGHSRKLGMDPAQRQRLVIAGKYGVGLLGFWSVGAELEMRTRVAGSELCALCLREDSPRAEIYALPLSIDALSTFTEVVILGVHETALRALGGRRLADYLAAELRGQLLRRDVEIVVHDRVARGLAQQRFEVKPRRFAGEPLALPAEVDVPGHAPIRVELYLARGAERPAIQVACTGTLVAEDIAALGALGLSEPPWVGRELAGMLDFPGFTVPPGTRRGVAPDAAALAFVEALGRLEPLVVAELERLASERRAALDREIVHDLQRALRGFRRRLPQYDLPHVAGRDEPDGAPDDGARLGDDATATESRAPEPTWLFPPGALASVRIVPSVVKIARGAERRVRAVACDADRREVEGVTFAWRVLEPVRSISVRGDGPRPAVVAGADATLGLEATLLVEAAAGDARAGASARVCVVEELDDDAASLGIPEPHLVSDPDRTWRSRMSGERWEVNDAHDDYRALRDNDRARFRYLLSLLAKEIVERTSGRPDAAELLESLVEVLAHAERNLRS